VPSPNLDGTKTQNTRRAAFVLFGIGQRARLPSSPGGELLACSRQLSTEHSTMYHAISLVYSAAEESSSNCRRAYPEVLAPRMCSLHGAANMHLLYLVTAVSY